MFTMMNNARLSVGLQGVAIAERAYQRANAFAHERLQGKSLSGGARVTISEHPDVKRMLLTMKAQVDAGRALVYDAALALDAARGGDAVAQAKVDVMTPIVKSWCSDMACEVTSIGVQVHGGMGFVEETGAAQYYRDARILPIYEGTNGIQAADLVFRKTLRDGGKATLAYIDSLESAGAEFKVPLEELRKVTKVLVEKGAAKDLEFPAAMAAPYLKAFGIIAAGAMLARAAAKAASHGDKDFTAEKTRLSQFYLTNILPLARGHIEVAVKGSAHI